MLGLKPELRKLQKGELLEKNNTTEGRALVLDKIGRWAIPLVTMTVNALSESD